VSEPGDRGPKGGGDPDGSAGGSPKGGAILPRGIDTPPPFWSRWSRLYWFVAGLLVFDIVVMWILTRWAS
jgi:hypothetical protein